MQKNKEIKKGRPVGSGRQKNRRPLYANDKHIRIVEILAQETQLTKSIITDLLIDEALKHICDIGIINKVDIKKIEV